MFKPPETLMKNRISALYNIFNPAFYDLKRIDTRCIEIAFETAEKIKTQSLAFDFIFDQKNNPKIVEISYCYQSKAVYNCSGYWDREMNWHAGHVWPEDAILIDLLEAITV